LVSLPCLDEPVDQPAIATKWVEYRDFAFIKNSPLCRGSGDTVGEAAAYWLTGVVPPGSLLQKLLRRVVFVVFDLIEVQHRLTIVA
jgi:hypothetical protein